MPSLPIEPLPSHVQFPDPSRIGRSEIAAVGADFSPGTLLKAYRSGIFPWPHSEELVPWCSPNPRAIFRLDQECFQWSKSLRRVLRTHSFQITIDTAFEKVMHACGENRKDGTWIFPDMIEGYVQLHRLGWAHSLEVWQSTHSVRELVGGIYGVHIGAYFAGESMFFRRSNASKIAFATLAETLRSSGFELFDVQVLNEHLKSLGCVNIRRADFLNRLKQAIQKQAQLPTQPIAAIRKLTDI